jgi:alpha-ketoglutarate-dependent taurine dioxygenase
VPGLVASKAAAPPRNPFDEMPGLPALLHLRGESDGLVREWPDVERLLAERGAILWRNLGLRGGKDLEDVLARLELEPLAYSFRSTPRTSVGNNIYTATEYPPDQTIPQHNENSYGEHWPDLLWFFCEQFEAEGGQTPLSDSRAVYREIDAAVRQEFIARGVLYERNFHQDLDLSWQTVFQTQSQAQMESFCSLSGIEVRWRSEGRPTIRHRGPVVLDHPITKEPVWFNQAHLFHVSSLAPQIAAALESLTNGEWPRNAYFGDGSPIPDTYLAEVRRAYAQCTVAFDWREGDLLLIDNVLTAHGRRPFRGARKISVAMCNLPGRRRGPGAAC